MLFYIKLMVSDCLELRGTRELVPLLYGIPVNFGRLF